MTSIATAGPIVRHSPETKWYDYGDLECAEQLTSNFNYLNSIEEQAEILLKRDCELQWQMQSKKNMTETAWLSTILTRGTANDKVTAMQILTQRHPVHSLPHVAALVNTVAKKNTREAFSVLGLLKDLFINELLPPTRKLIPFAARPVDKINLSSLDKDFNLKKKLILWKFESDLKAVYEKFIVAIERLAGENIEKLGILSCRYALELLIARAEQEQNLLSLLINKLGHPNKTLATRVCGYLLQLTRKQPLMRHIVVKEVERLIYRKNISCCTQLHAVSFLSQMNLHGCDPTLASTLLNIYIGLFRMLVLNKKMDDKILNVLLLATNRAFSFAKGDVDKLIKEIDTLYKILHQSNFSTALQTLKLLYQLLIASEGISDRFYAALYRRILDLQHGTNVDRPLFSLLYRALSSDVVEHRVIAFIKRLLQLSLCRNASFAAATLILISRLTERRPSLLIIKKAADVTKFSKDMKAEVIDDDEEVYHDFDPATEAVTTEIPVISAFESNEKLISDIKPCEKKLFGWMHKNNIVVRSDATTYDPVVRNPLFSRADKSIAAELILLTMHYHPSVAVFASNLLNGISIRYDSDPLLDFTQMRFLDRFVFRNPKIKNTNEKVMRRKVYDPHGVRKLPVISKEYAAKSRNEIPIDERFLHRYASMKMRMREENEGEAVHDDDDIESINSDEFNMLLDRFEPGERREVFDVDFSQEFSAEKRKQKKEVRGRKRPLENDTDEDEEDDMEKENMMDVDEDEELEEWSEKDIKEESNILEEEESSRDEFVEPTKGTYDSDDSDDFTQQFSYVEDAAISADKFTAMLEEENDSQKKESKRKIKKIHGFKERKDR
ncbi:CBF/Mak21 family protein [Loa loa]|uniref:CBF/Mak21 family protein n=1 Tax=Loa loa TaxID=7209 RepID=A0A1I7VSE4_LOALO|nr:CBF/Mak21 family protein [Loa loa]EFO27198.1 CBF/Mak21 family protein [Loa loa]